jgi:hypothetical protein
MRLAIAIVVGLAGLGTTCTSSTPVEDAPAEDPPADDGPTYYRDIAPIFARDCNECHRSGGIAPLALDTYEEAAPFAELIASVTAERTMPPSNLDNSGACNTFAGARWLTDADLATIAAWAQAGAPAGAATHEPPASPPAWRLDRVDLTIEMPQPYTPSELVEDEYRCFILDPGLTKDVFVTGFEVRLGRPEMVHHMTLFALDSAEDEQAAAALDAAEDGTGYTCFSDPQVPSRWLVSSGPGDRGGLLPASTGLRMAAGRKTVLQMHYNRRNGTFPDRTAIDLKLEPGVAHEAFVASVADVDIELPPGEPAVVETDTVVPGGEFKLWGVWPHMHDLGAQMRVTVEHAGGESCLAQVNDYEFHWQRFAFYDRPLRIHEGDTLRVTCTYDTTSRDTPTTWGYGTADEMCIAFIYSTEIPQASVE